MTFPLPADSALYLDDGATTYAPTGGGAQVAYGHYSGALRSYDFGVSVWRGFAAFEPSIVDFTTGDETYHLVLEGNTAADFTGASHDLASWNLKAVEPQIPVVINTVYGGTQYRYGRLRIDMFGTTPQIKVSAFLRPLAGMAGATLTEQITANMAILDNLSNAGKKLRDWSGGPALGGINHDGKYPLTDGSGNTLFVKSPDQIIADSRPCTPFEYGAIGSQGLPWGTWPSNPASTRFATLAECQAVYPFATSLAQEMDWLGWQAALLSGRNIRVDGIWHFKMCNSNPESYVDPCVLISGKSYGSAGYSEFHYEDMRLITDDTQFVSDPDFALSSGTPWYNGDFGANNSLPMTFGSGKAQGHDNSTDPVEGPGEVARFWSIGQDLVVPPGRYTISCSLNAKRGPSYGPPLNNNQPAYAGIGFFSESPGHGDNPFGRSADFDVQSGIFTDLVNGITQTRQFDIYVTEETAAVLTWQGGGYVDWTILHFGMKKWLPNTAFLLTRDGTDHHYPVPMGLKDFYVWGPDRSNHGVHCFRWKSFSNMDGNLVTIENVMMQGWGTQLGAGDGCYLTELRNVGGGDAHICIHTEPGTYNAGENLRFYGGGFGNSDICIHNEGKMEITFYGSSADYSTQTIIDEGGRVEFFGVHLECLVPTDVNKPLFDLRNTAAFRMIGGMFLGAGGVNTSPCAPIATNNSRCIAEFDGTELYNLTSAPDGAGKGAVMSGPGQIVITSWRDKGNPNIGPRVLSHSLAMDILGGAGKFEPVAEPHFFAGMGADPKGISLIGGSYIADADLVSTDNFNTRWDNARLTAEIVSDYALDGTRSLKVEKHAPYGVGNGCRLMLFVPAVAKHGIIGEFHAMFPDAVPGAVSGDVATLYYRRFWVGVIGYDVLGRPIVNQTWSFAGLENFTVPLDGSGNGLWQRRSISTLHLGDGSTDPASNIGAGAPAGATHLALLFDHESLPALSYRIDGLSAQTV